MSPGEVWLDDKNSQTVRVETIQVEQRLEIKTFWQKKMPQGPEAGFCGLNEPISGQIEYNCAESEQLYGIGYHKVLSTCWILCNRNTTTMPPEYFWVHYTLSPQVYEACKHNPILANYKVDWGVCLHAHYPWIDLLTR